MRGAGALGRAASVQKQSFAAAPGSCVAARKRPCYRRQRLPAEARPIMTDIVPSEELLAFMHRFYAAWQVWDFDTMNEMISAKPQLLIIGTDSAEWWNG